VATNEAQTYGPSYWSASTRPGEDWCAIDLCCGLGGISWAARELGCTILGGVDISKTALETFGQQFNGAEVIEGSVTTARVLDRCRSLLDGVPSDSRTLIISGPPCQGFSIAGPREKRDPRNRILTSVVRAVAKLQPDAAVIENVSALLAKKHRGHLQRLKSSLEHAGYNVTILQLDAADFGVPQRRRRMICFATKRPLDMGRLHNALEEQKRSATSVEEALAGLGQPPIYLGPGQPQTTGVPNHVAMRHSERVIEKIKLIEPGAGPMSYRRLHPQQVSRTLISGNRAPPAHFSEPRSITVREAARLQGFPDSFTVHGTFANQMLHVTNAVPPPLAKAALSALFRTWEATS
jgi:DNA (cytosine-5)-methyltransferase 1